MLPVGFEPTTPAGEWPHIYALEARGHCNRLIKSIPSVPEGSRKLRFPDYMTTAQYGGKFVSLTHRPPLPPGNTPGTHFY